MTEPNVGVLDLEGAVEKKVSTLAHLDHCHDTLKIRGILCVRCNQGIGCMQEDIEIMNNAIKYLEKHTEKEGDKD